MAFPDFPSKPLFWLPRRTSVETRSPVFSIWTSSEKRSYKDVIDALLDALAQTYHTGTGLYLDSIDFTAHHTEGYFTASSSLPSDR